MNNTYFFNEPAEHFEQAFPIGNGTLGAMIYGGTKKEKISINHDSLWSGRRFDFTPPENAMENYYLARELVAKGEIEKAAELLEQGFNCRDSQMYMPLGNIFIEHQRGEDGEYVRTLDMSKGKVFAEYDDGKVKFEHSYIASLDSECIAYRAKASRKGALSFVLSFEGAVKIISDELRVDKSVLVFTGKCPSYAKHRMQGASDTEENLIVYSDRDDESIMFTLCIKLVVTGGEVRFDGAKIIVENADRAEIFITCRTSFIDSYTLPLREHRKAAISAVKKCNDYDEIEKKHFADFGELYGRTSLELLPDDPCKKQFEKTPVDERLKSFDGSDVGLCELIFNFGRYLLISGSRKGSKPLNLQGIWNEKPLPPWNCAYTININFEMNYWPAFSCNLAECFEPFSTFIKNIVPSGMQTAKEYYGASGFVMHHNSDIWAHTLPVSPGFVGSTRWSPWQMASGWCAIQLYDGYEYTLDKEYLEEIYPVMKKAAEFYCDILEKDGDKLIITPASSPENVYLHNGNEVALAKTATMSQSIAAELFDRVVKASEILSCDQDFRSHIRGMIEKLDPYHIGSDGRLLEWDKEYEEPERDHRHVSHLFSLFPGENIRKDKTPSLAEACRASLEARGDDGTGWCVGWKTCLYSQLGDGNKAYQLLKRQLSYAPPTDKISAHGGGTFPNLFDAHPPFQIDGNFAASAAVANMLLQSEIGKIELLPALPDEWHSGKVTGLLARGNVKVDIIWENGRIKKAYLTSPETQKLILAANGEMVECELVSDKTLKVKF